MADHDGAERQQVVRVAGARRAKLTPAPGTIVESESADEDGALPAPRKTGPNDERMLRDVPPHY